MAATVDFDWFAYFDGRAKLTDKELDKFPKMARRDRDMSFASAMLRDAKDMLVGYLTGYGGLNQYTATMRRGGMFMVMDEPAHPLLSGYLGKEYVYLEVGSGSTGHYGKACVANDRIVLEGNPVNLVSFIGHSRITWTEGAWDFYQAYVQTQIDEVSRQIATLQRATPPAARNPLQIAYPARLNAAMAECKVGRGLISMATGLGPGYVVEVIEGHVDVVPVHVRKSIQTFFSDGWGNYDEWLRKVAIKALGETE